MLGSKALECGSFMLWEIVVCMKPIVVMRMVRMNPDF